MARATRAAAAATTAASKPVEQVESNIEGKTPSSSRKAKNARRRNQYKKVLRARKLEAIKTALQGADDPATKKELAKLRGQVYRPQEKKKKDSEQLQQLKVLLKKQQDEIEALKKALQGAAVPRLYPPASPTVDEEAGEAPDSSPTKIQEQLLMEVAQSSYDDNDDAEPEVPSTTVEVEEIVEETTGDGQAEQMEGVETTTVTTTTTTTTITADNEEVDYPTLPTVERDDAANEIKQTIEQASSSPERQEANDVTAPSSQVKAEATGEEEMTRSGQVTPKLSGTPLKPTEQFRDSSADSNAGTPRTVRRSPRKRTVKRRSFAGHSYAV